MLKHSLIFIKQEQKNMNEDLFVKLLEFRKYLDGQSDKFIAAGFDINSELISKFFESMDGIEKHIDKGNIQRPRSVSNVFRCNFRSTQAPLSDYYRRIKMCLIEKNSKTCKNLE